MSMESNRVNRDLREAAPLPSYVPSIPDIILGSVDDEGPDIEWDIRYDGVNVILEVNSTTIPLYCHDAVENFIHRQMEKYYPWVDLKFVNEISWYIS